MKFSKKYMMQSRAKKCVSIWESQETISKQLKLDIKKYNAQYQNIDVKKFDLSHDRFLIIDEKEVYHFGASLKDLGKKWFAVSKMEINSFELLEKLK